MMWRSATFWARDFESWDGRGLWETRTQMAVAREPLAVRAFLIEQAEHMDRFEVRAQGCTIVEARDDRCQLRRQGSLAVVPVATYWDKAREYRDFGAVLMQPGNVYFDAHVTWASKPTGDVTIYAMTGDARQLSHPVVVP